MRMPNVTVRVNAFQKVALCLSYRESARSSERVVTYIFIKYTAISFESRFDFTVSRTVLLMIVSVVYQFSNESTVFA